MSVPPNIQELLDALRRQGVVASLDSSEGIRGVPIGLRLQDGGTLVLDGGDLIPFDGFDTDQIGLAVLDGSGIVRASWGLARRCSPLAVGNNALATPLGSVLFQTFEGQTGMAYLDGNRFYAAPARYGKSLQVVVLVTERQRGKAAHPAGFPSRAHCRSPHQPGRRAVDAPNRSAPLRSGGARDQLGGRPRCRRHLDSRSRP
ncbi:MAG: hypothetical protein U0S12_12150 [Fimbriimonadales bacterium]